MEKFLEVAGIPVLMAVICLFYGVRTMLTGDTSLIRGKNAGALKDEAGYAKAAGKLLIFFAVANLVMGGLLFMNTYAAVAEIFVCTLILGVLWVRMNRKYGSLQEGKR